MFEIENIFALSRAKAIWLDRSEYSDVNSNCFCPSTGSFSVIKIFFISYFFDCELTLFQLKLCATFGTGDSILFFIQQIAHFNP